jgi:hypothetical protein
MKLGIISDTHDKPAAILQALDIFQRQAVDLVVHCGDWTRPSTAAYFADQALMRSLPTRGVLGNNDTDVAGFLALNSTRQDFSLVEGVLRFMAAGKRVVAYHGHHKPTLRSVLAEDCEVLCLGHSHKPRYDRIDSKIIVNPGSTAFAIPRSREWKASVAIYDSDSHEVQFEYFAV